MEAADALFTLLKKLMEANVVILPSENGGYMIAPARDQEYDLTVLTSSIKALGIAGPSVRTQDPK